MKKKLKIRVTADVDNQIRDRLYEYYKDSYKDPLWPFSWFETALLGILACGLLIYSICNLL